MKILFKYYNHKKFVISIILLSLFLILSLNIIPSNTKAAALIKFDSNDIQFLKNNNESTEFQLGDNITILARVYNTGNDIFKEKSINFVKYLTKLLGLLKWK